MKKQYFKNQLEKLYLRFNFHSNFGGYSNQDRDEKMNAIQREVTQLETLLFSNIEKDYFSEIQKEVKQLKKLVNAEFRDNNRLVEAPAQG